jgi:hypothetical protein
VLFPAAAAAAADDDDDDDDVSGRVLVELQLLLPVMVATEPSWYCYCCLGALVLLSRYLRVCTAPLLLQAAALAVLQCAAVAAVLQCTAAASVIRVKQLFKGFVIV